MSFSLGLDKYNMTYRDELVITSRLDGWGGRVEKVVTCESWKKLHEIASQEKLVTIGHIDDCVSLTFPIITIDFSSLKVG